MSNWILHCMELKSSSSNSKIKGRPSPYIRRIRNFRDVPAILILNKWNFDHFIFCKCFHMKNIIEIFSKKMTYGEILGFNPSCSSPFYTHIHRIECVSFDQLSFNIFSVYYGRRLFSLNLFEKYTNTMKQHM